MEWWCQLSRKLHPKLCRFAKWLNSSGKRPPRFGRPHPARNPRNGPSQTVLKNIQQRLKFVQTSWKYCWLCDHDIFTIHMTSAKINHQQKMTHQRTNNQKKELSCKAWILYRASIAKPGLMVHQKRGQMQKVYIGTIHAKKGSHLISKKRRFYSWVSYAPRLDILVGKSNPVPGRACCYYGAHRHCSFPGERLCGS